MDKLSEHFDQQIEKIAMLNDFIAVFGQRDKLKDALRVSRDTTDENRELIKRVKEKIRRFHTVLLPQAKCEIAKHERLQKIMLNMIEALDNEDADRAEQKGARGDVAQQLAPNNEETRHQVTPSSNRTPNQAPESTVTRLLVSDYKNSPFARRMKPAALQFIDFEALIKPNDFGRIATYMRGRETMADLQLFLDSVVVRCFSEKYTLLLKKRECVRNPQQLALWKHYEQQSEYFPQKLFITQGDIANLTGRLVDKKTSNRLAMLRHLQLLQEQRHKTTVCYVWLGMP